jgi:hypothetical protein
MTSAGEEKSAGRQGMNSMFRNLLGLVFTVALLSAAGAAMADEKCYDTVSVPASLQCSGMDGKSADFTSGCQNVAAHTEQVEIACPVGKWVNVIANTQMGNSGVQITQAQACAVYGLKPSSTNGKVCASGERPAQQGTGWNSINYKYGKKGGGNGNDGGDKLEAVRLSIPPHHTSSVDEDGYTHLGTMCYDRSMGEKNNTKQDAAIAVYCQ